METNNTSDIKFAYSPSALLNLFNNALNITATKKIVQVKGIYKPGNGQGYNGVYYDSLKDEASDSYITLIVPGLVRNKLAVNKTITLWGYITKKVVNNGGRIELHINLTELIEQTHNKYSDEEIRAFEIQQKKALTGYRDVQSFIKNKIISGETIKVALLIGKAAIIDEDIKHQLEETINSYDLKFYRTSFSSERDIVNAITDLNNSGTDILIIARGGGENIELFNKPSISEVCLSLNPYLITAIGHKENITLLQKIADKSFITPTALGQFLNDIYNDTVEELQNSKAKLVDDITKTLKANFDKQIQNLNEQIKASELQKQQLVNDLKSLNSKEKENIEKLNAEKITLLNQSIKNINEQQKYKEELISNYKRQIDSLQTQISKTPKSEFSWAAIIIGIIIGVIIGMIMASK